MTKLAQAGFKKLNQIGFKVPSNLQLKSSYEGASTTRRMGTWGTASTGPNSSNYSLNTMRSRSREVFRNNAYGSSATDSYVSNLIGTGIKPRWKLKEQSLKEELQELWEDWVDEADFYEKTSFYGLEELVGKTEFLSGEALAQFITRPLSEGLTVPLQIKVMEPDHLDETMTRQLTKNTYVMNGIEYDAQGKRSYYHLWRQHPSDTNAAFNDHRKIRVPAKDIMHVYQVDRPGQNRGVPKCSPILVRLHEIDQYEDAELVRKKTAAMFAAFITKSTDGLTGSSGFDASTGGVGGDGGKTENETPILTLEPGMMQYLGLGEGVTFSNPADVGSNFSDWMEHELHALAAGWGITYEQLTGDLSGVNYTSIRAGLLEFRRKIEMLQASMIIYQFCRPVVHRFVDMAVLSGAINIADFVSKPKRYKRVAWHPDGWDWVDPVKDQLGAKMEVRNGWNTRENIAAKRTGMDVESIDKQNQKDSQRARQYELVYDSDPGQTNNAGTIQQNKNDDKLIAQYVGQE